MTRTLLLLASLLLATAACTHAQRPYSFVVEKQNPVDEVVRALAATGHEATVVDGQAGVIHTSWQDTGFMYGEVDHQTATIVRRYTVTVHPSGGGATVSLRADTKRCAPGYFEIDGIMVNGRCEAMDGLVGTHQSDLDQLGQQLQTTLAAGMPVTTG